jgi:tellurite resistance protein
LTPLSPHGEDQTMELSRDQRRALLAMCIEVARADGSVNVSEYEGVLELLGRMAQGSVGYSEIEQWLQQGPPRLDVRLPEEAVKVFLREAVGIARADGKVDAVEIATIKELVARYFDLVA